MVGVKEEDNMSLCGLKLFVKTVKQLNQETFTDRQEWKLNMDWKHLYFRKLGRQLKVITWQLLWMTLINQILNGGIDGSGGK